MADNKIKAMFVFEILGRPPEHIVTTLNQLIDRLGENKGLEILNRKVHPAKPVDKPDAKDLFTSFAEIEVKVDNLMFIFEIVLNMLPAHVEILEPEELKLKNFDLSNFLSALTIKLHKYDEIAKTLTMERNILIKKLKELGVELRPMVKEDGAGQRNVEQVEEKINKENNKDKSEEKPKEKTSEDKSKEEKPKEETK